MTYPTLINTIKRTLWTFKLTLFGFPSIKNSFSFFSDFQYPDPFYCHKFAMSWQSYVDDQLLATKVNFIEGCSCNRICMGIMV